MKRMTVACLGLAAALCVGCFSDTMVMDDPLEGYNASPGSEDVEALLSMSVDERLARMPKGNVMVFVEKIATSAAAGLDASVAFRYADDRIAVSTPRGRRARSNGIRIGVGAADFRARFEVEMRTARSSSREQLLLTVLSGYEGSIRVGEETYFPRLGYWGPLGYEVLFEEEFLGADLIVRPRVLPDGLIEVELYPRFTERGGGRSVDVTELATTVRVRDGQPIIIGSATTETNEVGTALFGLSQQTQRGSMVVILTLRQGTQE